MASNSLFQTILQAKTIEECKDECLQLCRSCGIGDGFSAAYESGNMVDAEQFVIKAFNIFDVAYFRYAPFAPENICYVIRKKKVSYNNLKKLLIDKGLKRQDLAKYFSTSTMQRLWHDEPISGETQIKLCEILECNIEDIMSVVYDTTGKD